MVASLITLGLHQAGVITPLENAAYRGLFRLRGELQWDERVVLITIDEATLAQLGEFPLSREYYTQLLRQLEASPPAVIGFNILFIEPSPADAEFARAIAEANNVVLASAVDERGHPLKPVVSLRQAAIGTGHILKEPDSDGLVHYAVPRQGGQTALGLVLVDDYNRSHSSLKLWPLETPLWINWPGSQSQVTHYSFGDVVAERIAPAAFKDKIVLVGVNAVGSDPLPTPYDYDPPGSGLLLHAAVVDNVLQQRSLHRLTSLPALGLLLLSMPALSYWLFGKPVRWQLAIVAGGLIGWWGFSLLLFYGAYQVPIVLPLIVWGLTGIDTLVSQQLRSNWELQHLLRDLWAYYCQDTRPTLWPPPLSNARFQELGPEVGQLANLANTWGWAQATQNTIAQSVPIGLLAADDHDQVWFCNDLAKRWLPVQLRESLTTALVPHWIDIPTWQWVQRQIAQRRAIVPMEIEHQAQWFELRFERLETGRHPHPLLQDDRQGLLVVIENITSRKAIEGQLRSLNQGLTTEILQRSAELQTTNRTLMQQILERQRVQEKLTYQALHDELTGLSNRAQFKAQLTSLLERSQQGCTDRFAVLFIDCDRFKLVNDSFGHLVGDKLLQAIAQRLIQSIARTDLVSRFGGDEFTILLTQIQDAKTAIRIAQRIRQQLQQPFQVEDQQLYTGCSIGIVLSSPTYQQADEMLRDADTAMYQAKRSGQGSLLFKPEMHLAVRSSLQLETDLRRALKQQELVVHYQPIFDIETQTIAGFEALLRWYHPQHGVIGPNKFIPIAEETGLIISIGEWVMQTACQQLRNWQEQRLISAEIFMSINLSVQQFNEERLLKRIDAALETTQLDSQYLKLEITESAIMANSDTAVNTFKALKERGILLGIDDFGTGYSSLSYLHSFPIDVLKVDRSFIQRMTTGYKHLSLVQAIKTLSHHFEMTMVAEGIENATQMDYLRSMKCSLGQGYFFSPPVDHSIIETRYLSLQS